MPDENAVETPVIAAVKVAAEKPVKPVEPVKPLEARVKRKAPARTLAKPAAGATSAMAPQSAQPKPLKKAQTKPQTKAQQQPPVRKALAKAVPVAPWPPAAVTGGPVAASATAAPPVGRKAGAVVGAKAGAKKLPVKPAGAKKPVGKAAARSSVKPVKPAPKRAKPHAAVGDDKSAKARVKLVRDSFTMPQVDFDLIDALKKRALGFQHPAKKSELLRAGLQALASLDDARLGSLLKGLPLLKPGRPKKAD